MKNLSRSTLANRIFSNVPTLTSVDQRTQLTNERFDPTYPPSAHRSWLAAILFFLLHVYYGSLRVYVFNWDPRGTAYLLSSFDLLRAVRDPLRAVRNLLRVVRDPLRAIRVFTIILFTFISVNC
ncbi:hypothetical protein T10_1785 [Trichinella papuae]|uniref:Uncharacterized protein n=1 Tax=Trichinella papuae TaxID=268474 RepID=A0A0V1M040_9BILA|nr:hypothetical protein T10_1785 [Trichinella papuae]